MRNLLLTLLVVLASACSSTRTSEASSPVVLAIHGGAGTISKKEMTREKEHAYRTALAFALRTGHAAIQDGKNAVDAVVAAIEPLENSPLFNAGVGAVLTHDERCELDASIMDGARNSAGAVAGVTTVANPIRLARAVMDSTEHVLLSGAGAEAFAVEFGLPAIENEALQTERRRDQLEARKRDDKFGTVGCVALDKNGNLAAGTSTGGMTNKRWGRVGDSPIIGAGVWAENATCAISSTGWGEFFLRGCVAHDIASRMRYLEEGVWEAANGVIMNKLDEAGGTGGVIALDRAGNVAAPFNTKGMYRGWITADGEVTVEIYR